MSHQDFEKYAKERLMNGAVAENYKEYFFKFIDYNNNNLKVLDIGCGDGKYFNFFKHFFKEENIFGTEISRIRVERCKNKGWRKIYLIKKMEKLPFSDKYFDLINYDQVIEHIPKEEIHFYLKEMKRILKKDGKLILMTPNYPIKRLYDFLNVLLKRDLKRIFDDPTHVTYYNFKRLNNVLKKQFSCVELYPTGGIFYKYFKKNFWSHKIISICIKT